MAAVVGTTIVADVTGPLHARGPRRAKTARLVDRKLARARDGGFALGTLAVTALFRA